MKDIIEALQQFDFRAKDVKIYIELLSNGPQSIRALAAKTNINRGSVYESLKKLKQEGFVDYHHKDKKQFFSAENPEKIKEFIERRKRQLEQRSHQLFETIPQLKSLYTLLENRPIIKYFEDVSGTKSILNDILETMSDAEINEYMVYSPSEAYIYEAYPDFSKDRVEKKIYVKAIAIGKGGETYGFDQRKWLKTSQSIPTYTFIYGNKIAMLSKNNSDIRGIIVEDHFLYQTQKLIFESIWQIL